MTKKIVKSKERDTMEERENCKWLTVKLLRENRVISITQKTLWRINLTKIVEEVESIYKNYLFTVFTEFWVHALWKLWNFYCHDFIAKIPSNQLFTKELHSKLIWRKNICVAVNFSFFHSVHTVWKNIKFSAAMQNFFRQIDLQ